MSLFLTGGWGSHGDHLVLVNVLLVILGGRGRVSYPICTLYNVTLFTVFKF